MQLRKSPLDQSPVTRKYPAVIMVEFGQKSLY
jgi:hypothetical protein